MMRKPIRIEANAKTLVFMRYRISLKKILQADYIAYKFCRR
ncbi:MAG: hypothetical protein UIH18_09265 [Fibrobacteraceae bacterium]|nr:hypothetical protein [Fibrobacteraceae bacterium]